MSDPLIEFLDRRTPERFERVVRQTSTTIVNAAYRILGDPSAAEDVAQEVYMKLLDDDWPRQPVRSGVGFLVHSAIFKAKTLLRSRSRRRRREQHAALAESVASQEASAIERWALIDAVASLDPSIRVSIELYYFGCIDAHAIAEQTGVAARTVRDQLDRGRRQLRSRLQASPAAGASGALLLIEDPARMAADIAVREDWIAGVCRHAHGRLTMSSVAARGSRSAVRAVAMAAVVLLLAGVAARVYWPTSAADERASADASHVEKKTSKSNNSAPPMTKSATPTATDTLATKGPTTPPKSAPVADAGAAPTRLVVEVVDVDGVYVSEGQLLFGGTPLGTQKLIEHYERDPEAIDRFQWLLQPQSLARANPFEVDGIPDLLCGIESQVDVVVPGYPRQRKSLVLKSNETTTLRFVLDDRVAAPQVDAEPELGPLSLRIDVVDADGEPVVDGILHLEGGLGLMLLGMDGATGLKLAPFAWLEEPIDLRDHNPLIVKGLPAELTKVQLTASVQSELGVAASQKFHVSKEAATELRFELVPPESITVTVVTKDGESPIAGAAVINRSVFDAWGQSVEVVPEIGIGSSRTGRNGRTIVAVAKAEEQRLVVRAPGYRSRRVRLTTERETRVALEPIAESGRVIVEIVDAEGSDALRSAELAVRLQAPNESIAEETHFDANGTATFDRVPTGWCYVSIDHDRIAPALGSGGLSALEKRKFEVDADSTTRIRLGFVGTAEVSGRVLTAGGLPIPWTRVLLRGPQEIQLRAGLDGRVRFSGLTTGDYELVVGSFGHTDTRFVPITIGDGDRLDLEWKSGQQTVRGTLSSDEPLSSARLRLIAEDGSYRLASLEEGHFEFRQVPVGRYRLVARAGRYAPSSREIDVREGQDVDELDIPMQPPSHLQVTFKPRLEAFGYQIRIFDEFGEESEFGATGGGYRRTGPINAGDYTIELIAKDGTRRTHRVHVGFHEDLKLEADPHTLEWIR